MKACSQHASEELEQTIWLTHEDLARRIRSIDLVEGPEDGEPRWIDAAELVRRVAPWTSLN
jgi:hypothetical protein